MSVPVRGGSVSAFVPAVPAIDSGGTCRSGARLPGTPPGQRTLVVRYGAKPENGRSVAVTVNGANVPIRYSDLRGDLRAPFDKSVTTDKPLGIRTSIAIDLRDTTAMLSNENTPKPQAILRVYGAAILTAENLGVPSQQIARVLAECGANGGGSAGN